LPPAQIDWNYSGEHSWPTQLFSTISLAPEQISPADAWGPTPEDIRWCHDKIQTSRWEGMFTPPSLQGTIMFPDNVGGVNWGSAAYDPIHHTMVANTNRLIAWIKLIPRDQYKGEQHKQQDNRIYGSSEIRGALPMGSIAPFCFLPAERLATLRRGGQPKQSIYLPARRCGMFRWERLSPVCKPARSTWEDR
jgi:glucose dehydrogenase